MKRFANCVAFLTSLTFLLSPGISNAAPKPEFASPLVTSQTSGHAVDVDVELGDAKQLFLVVTDGGNGIACDWADWAEPRLIGPEGDLPLTKLKWKSANASWGQVRVNQNADGGPLRIAGQSVEYGIGTHANSVIQFELPEGYSKFKARAGLDNGGTNQQGGKSSSVRFFVYFEKPSLKVAQPAGADAGNRAPEDAVSGLDVYDGLEATLFAAEPSIHSVSNIDVDHRGRVWVCEIVNYRSQRNRRPEGDRILILEDTDGDGRADGEPKVFYQGRDIDSPHGVCVLATPDFKGTRVIVSAGDKVQVFTDEDGDDTPDKKETLFQGVGGVQHDHGIHAFVFGPDGKLYFNFGNSGNQIRDKHGQIVVDLAGRPVQAHRQPYQQGMVFRCNLDGSEFETLGWNFRNNWMVTVDSFGTMWQSDNDDDGNRGVRINYVMEYGNYGYRDELTGAGWKSPRTGMAGDVPTRHWHQNDPGVVPNLLQTGAGSPTGITIYEGRLLPEVFQGEMIHCDAGPNVCRAYPVEKDGAGYSAEIVNLLHGARDRWYRPSDVTVAPDGSVFVADWYDPGVGGHRAGDLDSGRIFRVAPPKTAYEVPEFDFSRVDGAIDALKNPNYAVRYVAWQTLHAMGGEAKPALVDMFATSDNPRHRARALWLLSKIGDDGILNAIKALDDPNPDIRITALRAARQAVRGLKNIALPTLGDDTDRKSVNVPAEDVVPELVRFLVHDPSPQVRRECAIALRNVTAKVAAPLWAELALQHDGHDGWYLEALGLAADGRWDACFPAWSDHVSQWNSPDVRDIVWRSRATQTPLHLVRIITDPSVPQDELPRYLRAFDFLSGPEKQAALVELAFSTRADGDRQTYVAGEALKRLKGFNVNKNPQHRAALDRVLESIRGTAQFVSLVNKFNLNDRYDELLALAQQKPAEPAGIEAVRVLLARKQQRMIGEALSHKDRKLAEATAQALGNSADGRALNLLWSAMNNPGRPVGVRREAVRGVARSQKYARQLVDLAESSKLDPALKPAVAAALHTSQFGDVKQAARELFPLPPTKNKEPLPPITELAKLKGDPARGRLLFNTDATCIKCHKVRDMGKEVGPDLSEIGSKLSRQAMLESILYPSAGISHNYETYVVLLESGVTVTGIVTSRTDESLTIKDEKAVERTFKQSEIEEVVKQNISLMPADLQKVMTQQDLLDVVEFMLTLKKTGK